MNYAVAFVTVSSPEEAQRIGRAIVDERLAACANVLGDITSRYWWKGRIEEAGEVLIIFKTREDLLPALTDRVRALHSYTVPEVIGIPVIGGNPEYLEWIDASTQSSHSTPADRQDEEIG